VVELIELFLCGSALVLEEPHASILADVALGVVEQVEDLPGDLLLRPLECLEEIEFQLVSDVAHALDKRAVVALRQVALEARHDSFQVIHGANGGRDRFRRIGVVDELGEPARLRLPGRLAHREVVDVDDGVHLRFEIAGELGDGLVLAPHDPGPVAEGLARRALLGLGPLRIGRDRALCDVVDPASDLAAEALLRRGRGLLGDRSEATGAHGSCTLSRGSRADRRHA
jgi:hypothetical protein